MMVWSEIGMFSEQCADPFAAESIGAVDMGEFARLAADPLLPNRTMPGKTDLL
jgi:hypothetical protein